MKKRKLLNRFGFLKKGRGYLHAILGIDEKLKCEFFTSPRSLHTVHKKVIIRKLKPYCLTSSRLAYIRSKYYKGTISTELKQLKR